MTAKSLTDRAAEGRRNAATDAAAGWKDHPAFAGVRLKSLVSAEVSAGALSTLIVKLAPGAAMRAHRHETQMEQHFVLEGGGCTTLGDEEVAYAPGALMVIPTGAEHSVTAGPHGMVLMAVFSPANV